MALRTYLRPQPSASDLFQFGCVSFSREYSCFCYVFVRIDVLGIFANVNLVFVSRDDFGFGEEASSQQLSRATNSGCSVCATGLELEVLAQVYYSNKAG